MRTHRRLSLAEILAIIACVGMTALLLRYAVLPGLGRSLCVSTHRSHCMSRLQQLAQAMQMYMLKFGGTYYYAAPAESFV